MSPFCDSKTNIVYDLCCPANCSNGTVKNDECITQCPDDMHIIKQSCLNSKDEVLVDFTCVSTCPVDFFGILLNNTNVCVECSLLCQTPYFKTLCACRNQEEPSICKLYAILTIAMGTTSACLLIVFTLIVGYKLKRKCSADTSFLQRSDQEMGLKPEEFKISTETDLKPDTNKIETADGNPTPAKIAKEAQTTLDEKSRYVKDPTENIKALHQKENEASMRQSHVYANLSTIQQARNFFNRTSRTLYNIIRPKSMMTISEDKTQCLPTDNEKNSVVDEAVYNSIIDDGTEFAHCSGDINVPIECHVMSECIGLSANNQFDREKDTNAGMSAGTKTSKTVSNIKTRNFMWDKNEGVKNTKMQGTKVKKKKRALQKTNLKQTFTEPRIQDGKTENSLLVGTAGVEKTSIEESRSKENEHEQQTTTLQTICTECNSSGSGCYNTTKVKEPIYENVLPQREEVDKILPGVPSNNSITSRSSSSSGNSQGPSSDVRTILPAKARHQKKQFL